MPPTLDHVFTLRGFFEMDHILNIKSTKGGPERMVIPISSGFMKGSGLDAKIIPGGTDCLLLDTEAQVAHLDVRLSLRLKDDHTMFVHYNGVLKIDNKSIGPAGFDPKAKSTTFGDHEWFATPIIETSDPSFKWVESSVFVAEGRWVVEQGRVGFEYQYYRARPSN